MKYLISTLAFIVVLATVNQSYSQINVTTSNFVNDFSPSLQKINQELNIQHDLYRGKVNFGIEVSSINITGLDYPVSLSYEGGSGALIEELPSFVGLGFKINAIGFVHREIRGTPDELKHVKVDELYSQFTGQFGDTNISRSVINEDFNYLKNYEKLNVNNWNQLEYFNLLTRNSDDKPIFTSQQDQYFRQTLTTYGSKPVVDLVPDEFFFSVGTFNGKFFLGHDGKWKVIAGDGRNYTVEVVIHENYDLIERTLSGTIKARSSIPRIIQRIVLTSSDGFRLIFGSQDDNSPVVEYSEGSKVRREDVFESYGISEVVPSRWLIRKIENINTKDYLEFEYELPNFQFQVTHSARGSFIPSQGTENLVFKDGSYTQNFNSLSPYARIAFKNFPLKSIASRSGHRLEFKYADAQQINSDQRFVSWPHYFHSHIFMDEYYSKNNILKLVSIEEIFQNKTVKNVDLQYIDRNTERLKLESILLGDGRKFIFSYDSEKLPEYGSRKKDHFGQFNNKDFFEANSRPYAAKIISGVYYNSREPDSLFSQAEILKEIRYPTGGVLKLFYERNEYSTLIDSVLNIKNQSKDIKTGGLRIQKMAFFDGKTELWEKRYVYQRAVDNRSSGVISYRINYLAKENVSSNTEIVSFRADRSFGGAFTNNICNYSEVTEITKGKGKVTYTYSTHNNGFKDKLPDYANINLTSHFRGNLFFMYAFKDQSFKRGKLLKQEFFNNEDLLLKEIQYKYDHDFPESGKTVLRSLYLYKYNNLLVYCANQFPIYSNKVREKKVITHYNEQPVVEKESYVYDAYDNLIEKTKESSDGNITSEAYVYPYNYSGTSSFNSSIFNKMKSRGMLSSPVEIITRRNNLIVEARAFSYVEQVGIIIPAVSMILKRSTPGIAFKASYLNNSGQLVLDSNYIKETEVISISELGNILEIDEKFNRTSFLWGYGGTLKVAEVVHASSERSGQGGANEVFYEGFEESVHGEYFDLAIGGKFFRGDYTVPFRATGSKSFTIDYRYLLDGKFHYVTKPFVNDMVLTEGSGIDEVRVYPSGSQMFSYTYRPLIGVTSKTDGRGVTEYYKYDSFGRLSAVIDFDGNILKTYCYNYAGQRIDCLEPAKVYENVVKSQTFQKNNCPTGQTGRTAIYTVPAGKYTSTFSQADADEMAQEDIDQNGQAYVNSITSCDFVMVDVPLVKYTGWDGEILRIQFFDGMRLIFSVYPKNTGTSSEDEILKIPAGVYSRVSFDINTQNAPYVGVLSFRNGYPTRWRILDDNVPYMTYNLENIYVDPTKDNRIFVAEGAQ